MVDASVIEALRALDRKHGTSRVERALATFTGMAPSLAAEIVAASERGDAEALWRAAHSLSSSSGALGAVRLSARCAEIETQARAGGVEAARAGVAALAGDLTATLEVLRA